MLRLPQTWQAQFFNVHAFPHFQIIQGTLYKQLPKHIV